MRKVWDDGNATARPTSVVVQLLCDGKVYAEKQLDSSNNWNYTWSNLPEGHMWTVVEKTVPSGYTATVTRNGTLFTITNSNPPSKLPQTGQTWWPVPLLFVLGMAMFRVGMVMVRQEKDQHEKKR